MPRRAREAAQRAQARAAHRPRRGRSPRLSRAHLEERLAAALAAADGLQGAHCIHELWMRGEFPTRIEQALERLWQQARGLDPRVAADALHRLAADSPTRWRCAFAPQRKGRSHLYLVLLDYADRTPRAVRGLRRHEHATARRSASTSTRPASAPPAACSSADWRCSPARSLHLQYLARAEAQVLEGALAEALGDAGLLVEGGH